MTHLFKVAAGTIALAALSACTTMKEDTAPQMSAVVSQPSSQAAPSAMASSSTAPAVPPSFDIASEPPPDRVYFEYDKADLNEAALATLQKQAEWLGKLPAVVLVIEGHSDERGTREYNLALSARRASAVRTYLITQGISAARLETLSYGKERPSCTGSEETCWTLNRRAVSTVNLEATNRRN